MNPLKEGTRCAKMPYLPIHCGASTPIQMRIPQQRGMLLLSVNRKEVVSVQNHRRTCNPYRVRWLRLEHLQRMDVPRHRSVHCPTIIRSFPDGVASRRGVEVSSGKCWEYSDWVVLLSCV